MNEKRPWGEFTVYEVQPNWWVKKITVKAGESISVQKHLKRSENWVCVEGTGVAEVGGTKHSLSRGGCVWFGPGVIHTVTATTELVFIEVATGERVEESDIKRYEDKYGRV